MTIKCGVVGAGIIGRLRAESLRDNPGTTLVAVCDVVPESAAAAAKGSDAVVAPNLDAFFRVPMDAVVISSPIQNHEDACLAAFERGMHVLCEKPLSNSIESCERIVAAAIRAKRTLAIGFNLRYYPAMQYVRAIVDAGTIGPIDHVRVDYAQHEFGVPVGVMRGVGYVMNVFAAESLIDEVARTPSAQSN